MGISAFGYNLVKKARLSCAVCDGHERLTYWVPGAMLKAYFVIRHAQQEHPEEAAVNPQQALLDITFPGDDADEEA